MATLSTTSTTGGSEAATSRLNCRLRASIKERAEEAARVLGQSITDFTEQALAERADAVLDEAARIRLSERDFAHFRDLISEAPPPTPALREAAEEYKRLRQQDPGGNW